MNQEFKIGNLKLIQDEDGYAVMRMIGEGMWEPIATFKYPEDAVAYFNGVIMEAVAYMQNINTGGTKGKRK
jgi:hypothetical protein